MFIVEQKYIRQSYYACVSYIDDLIGQVLLEIKMKGLNTNTAIVLLGDHGWSMGEHNEWSKYSNFDIALKVPFIISVPKSDTTFDYINPFSKKSQKKVPKKEFKKVEHLVELVDIFPTLAELAQLPVPPICKENTTEMICREGVSLKPLMFEKMLVTSKWKSFVFSQYPRPSLTPQLNSDQPMLKDIKIMGYSMKASNMRYTEWIGFDSKTLTKNWSQVFARELYFGGQQNCNFGEDKRFKKMIPYFSGILKNGWRGQLSHINDRD